MSTIKVNKIENTSTTNGGVSIDNDGHVKIDGQQMPTAGPLSNRNLIINGAMRVAQRGTSVSAINSAGYKTIDRMRLSMADLTTAQFTHEQVSDAPAGFSHSLKLTTTTAEGSVGAQDALRPVEYRFEGQDLQQLQYGTADAKNLTLSFYVKSSEEGTYGITLYRDEATDRQISATYSIAAGEIGQWVYRTITFPGDTGSAITSDDIARFYVYMHTGAGSDYTSTDSTSWGNYIGSGFAYGNTVNLQNVLNATWQVTGIQLEVGNTATSFEHRSYGDELARCQRYCYRMDLVSGLHFYNGMGWNVNIMFGSVELPVRMRARPTVMTPSGAAADYQITMGGNQDICTALPSLNGSSVQSVQIRLDSTGNVTIGQAGMGTVTSTSGDQSIVFDGGSEL